MLAFALAFCGGAAALAHHGEGGPHPVARPVQHRQTPTAVEMKGGATGAGETRQGSVRRTKPGPRAPR